MIRRLLVLALLACGALTWAWLEVIRLWETPLHSPGPGYRIHVAQGDTLASVAATLRDDGIFAHPVLLRAYGRFTGLDQQIKRGEYALPEYATIVTLLDRLTSGQVIEYQVTIPEGVTFNRAVAMIRSAPTITATADDELTAAVAQLIAPVAHPEGLFFPDSYRYERGASELDILRRAYLRMQDVLAELWQERAAQLPYESPYEVLVMASIVEKETGLAEERPAIAGVFVRRLLRGMRLQTDPTIIYGLGQDFDGNLRRSHLRDDANLYNTYRHHGLPPTPIALPGRAAIHASLHPADGDALFFVARGDGGHVFSATLAEHERAVRKYQLQRRSDYRSSPPPK